MAEAEHQGREHDGESVPSPDALHALYQLCHEPLKLAEMTESLIKAGASCTHVNGKGFTALMLVILHTNRGLRYHSQPIPALNRLEDLKAPKAEITALCQKLDVEYQTQVYQCLEMLLGNGAQLYLVPLMCPAIPYSIEWNENYEHKIMQSEQRWNLLGLGGSMEYSTYSIFNPLSLHRVANDAGITLLDLAAWRGDANCIELLLRNGAVATMTTTDGRNALHFLYHYCNKPADLVKATQLLIEHGTSVNCADIKKRTPMYVLVSHVFAKRSYVKYLANAYTPDYEVLYRDNDHYRSEIKTCVQLLLAAGANINHFDRYGENIINALYTSFLKTLQGAEQSFQIKGHYLVPHEFKVKPLAEFTRFFLQNGCKIHSKHTNLHTDTDSCNPLHKLVNLLDGLSLDPQLNPVEHLTECFHILLSEGLSLNAQAVYNYALPRKRLALAPIHNLVQNLLDRQEALMPLLETLLQYQPDFNSTDGAGNSVLHMVCRHSTKPEQHQRLMLFLLQCGANPSTPNREGKYPLSNLLRHHVYHHDPLYFGDVHVSLIPYVENLAMFCRVMNLESLHSVVMTYKDSGLCGLVCKEECPVYQALEAHFADVRTLKDTCRLTTWRTMKAGYYRGVGMLPLPRDIRTFLLDFTR